jgi:exopolyphosphatase/guanosine-5'-triphosphate,3'-diphosphate pyrophosphatase
LKLAAIDIGSNAIRCQITEVIKAKPEVVFKRLEYIRFPLRLGDDVFSHDKISKKTEDTFVKLMATFKNFIDLYDVDDYIACATSAMREAMNGQEICQRVYHSTGLKIHIIDGDKEAELINSVIIDHLEDCPCVHIDVGGGSTEINIYNEKKKIAAKSFKIGSVRILREPNLEEELNEIRRWTERYRKQLQGETFLALGTGGNISKLLEIANNRREITISKQVVEETKNFIASFEYFDRIIKLKMNKDRADVILPAVDIYLMVMNCLGASDIRIPDVGLKDGLISYLYKQYISKREIKNSEPQ